ncbi:hypothetical protein F506_09680 [Herbaspirillum hiltneri N3]|uniref:Uncharacterized protein n=1 Tax=Herbaspirillum hiltneri N3 TaxID=1262470 RepID=A0ABM5V056_9BURK|nr:hypothetical protein [Herbaspirillum hiltneri]AKZ62909.1 hypothetical protein F506_09680 [Herbaspirillum hiltneri N3]
MNTKNQAIAAAAGEAAARDMRVKQTVIEAERRAQSLRSCVSARLKSGRDGEEMPDDCTAADPFIGAAVAVGLEGCADAAPGRPSHRSGDTDGGDMLLEDSEPSDEVIIGSGDRAQHMALKNAFVPFSGRPSPVARRPATLPPLRPTSRAECGRRCGKGGFCDPSSELGCGGEYCGNRYVMPSPEDIAPAAKAGEPAAEDAATPHRGGEANEID